MKFYNVLGYFVLCWGVYFATVTMTLAIVGGYRSGVYLLSLIGG